MKMTYTRLFQNYNPKYCNVNEKSLLAKDKGGQDMEIDDTLGYCGMKTLISHEWPEAELKKYDYNKENASSGGSSNSYNRTPQRTRCRKVRHPLENYEENSQDSGHGSSPVSDKEEKRLEDYVTFATVSPHCRLQYNTFLGKQFASASLYHPSKKNSITAEDKIFLRSLSSGYESMDDGLTNELIDMETMDEETQLPTGISKLLSGDIVAPETSTEYDVSPTPNFSRSMSPKIKMWLSLNGKYRRNIKTVSSPLLKSPTQTRSPLMTKSPSLSKIRTCLFRSPTAACSTRTMMRTCSYDTTTNYYTSPNFARSYKRPSEDLLENDTSILKRSRKSNSLYLDATPVSARHFSVLRPKPSLQRSLSETETHANIKWAVHRSVTDTDLIGDFSKPCILPLTISQHSDLKTITSETLAALLRGEFIDRIRSYKIIDCRYPYEYEGGHIEGALNLYSIDLIKQNMLDHLNCTVPRIQSDTDKRDILVFHCEFSQERGPNLSRTLRRLDRTCNKEYYPALYYPEIYLLQGGYKKFYSEQKEFCSPQDYKSMKHPNHEEECRFFRNKSKSWQGDKSKGISQTVRVNLEHLDF
ncbi:hypothetical protein P5V15_003762 [Pogonomyrmex californicus]